MLLYAFNGLVFLLLGPRVARRCCSALAGTHVAGARAVRDRAVGWRSTCCASPGSFRARTCRRCSSRKIREREGSPQSARRVPRRLGRLARLGDDGRGAVDPAGHRARRAVSRARPHHLPRRRRRSCSRSSSTASRCRSLIRCLDLHGDGNAQREERAARDRTRAGRRTALRAATARAEARRGDRVRAATGRRLRARACTRLPANAEPATRSRHARRRRARS